jgi:hypothetical protein
VVGATTKRTWGAAARAATTPDEGVIDPGRPIVYNGLVLFDMTITFLVERSLIDKPNRSNSIELQLSMVKQWTERRLWTMSGAGKILLR